MFPFVFYADSYNEHCHKIKGFCFSITFRKPYLNKINDHVGFYFFKCYFKLFENFLKIDTCFLNIFWSVLRIRTPFDVDTSYPTRKILSYAFVTWKKQKFFTAIRYPNPKKGLDFDHTGNGSDYEWLHFELFLFVPLNDFF